MIMLYTFGGVKFEDKVSYPMDVLNKGGIDSSSYGICNIKWMQFVPSSACGSM